MGRLPGPTRAGSAINGITRLADADLDDWEMIDTSCKGLAYCTRAILPCMVARGRGHVINLGSAASVHPYPGGNAYGGTKAFVHQFSPNLRSDLHGTGVRVTCIEPGLADTEFSTVRFSGDRTKADAVYEGMQPLTAGDIAESVYWAATLPPHVNVNTIELMPVARAHPSGPSGLAHRTSPGIQPGRCRPGDLLRPGLGHAGRGVPGRSPRARGRRRRGPGRWW